MQTYPKAGYTKTALSVIATVAVVMFLVALAAPRARADDDRAKCQHRIEKAEARLHEAVAKHGEHSDEARARRHDLVSEREACWNRFHQWWDGGEHRWHDDRDWDRDDPDHDHDHPQP